MYIERPILKSLAQLGANKADTHGAITLIGPPRSGKTTVWRELALEDGYTPLLINPAICPPEDVGGIPVLNRTKGTATYSQPLIIPPHLMQQKKVWIIVDELDKADPANQVPLLTLFAERRIREFQLPPLWRVSACMNEPKGIMEEALVERLLFLPYAPTLEAIRPTLQRLKHLPLNFYKEPEVRFPERTVTRGALHYLDSWSATSHWRDKDTRAHLVRGVLPSGAAVAMISELDNIDTVIDPLELMTKAGMQDVATCLIRLLCESTKSQELFDSVMSGWAKRVETDKTGEWQRLLDAFGNNYECPASIAADQKEDVILAAQAVLDKALTAK
jgi:hypothetical protein